MEERCHGLETTTLGKHLSERECVYIAADNALFVGVDSGMSHLCHSVGVPISFWSMAYPLPPSILVRPDVSRRHGGVTVFVQVDSRIERYRVRAQQLNLPTECA